MKVFTLKEVQRMFGLSYSQVKSIAKWYALSKRKSLDDFMMPKGPHSFSYAMPPDFIDYVRKEVKRREQYVIRMKEV